MAGNNMHNLTTLIKRLEAATSRLEDIASSTVEPPTAKSNGTSTAVASPPSAPVAAPLPPPIPALAEPVEANAEPLPESVEDFDSFIDGSVKKYVALSQELGGPVAEQAASVSKAFASQRNLILISTKAKKPDMGGPQFMQLLQPLADSITLIGETRERNRASPLFNHLSAVSESIGVLAWVQVDPRPEKHVEESLGSAQYWGNRVLKEFKEKDPKQVQWMQSYYQIFKDLSEFVKDTFQQGIPWNPKGVAIEEAMKLVGSSGLSSAPAAGGAPPPPPPPGPPPSPLRFDSTPEPAPAANAGGLGAVFSELNKGEAVTKGLKKVSADQMTHKNPSLRAGATVPTRSDSTSSVSSISRNKSPAPGKKPKPESMRTKKPPVKTLDGNKWYIENYDGDTKPIEIEASISQSILISRCNKTTVIVKGKANAISIDNSPRLSLIVESLVSSIDVIKSNNFALQVMGTLPTILMDQVDGAQVYLGPESMNTEVFSSKSSSINLNIIDTKSEDGDYKEVPLPEQIRTWVGKDRNIHSEIVEHAG
ncbi:adenylyl cyclase-associated protein-like protein [Calycina marina]|uniref:Adenylyl cyclase-associated protein n=1 Tax=Calycina marina TaxID=1763456 RepID=A0A9P7Z247_9HELO|nr:adenylyl cyclase-associated protein-like protein [Calycina marina]